MKRIMIALLSGLMAINSTYAIHAEETDAETEYTVLESYPSDPEDLHVERLGIIDKDDTAIEGEMLPFRLDDIVRVSIELDEQAVLDTGYSISSYDNNKAAQDYRAWLKNRQNIVSRAIEDEIGEKLDVKWNLTLTVNIISANVKYGDIEKIGRIPGVKNVFLENRYDAQVDEVNTANTSTAMVGAAQTWNQGYTGAGTKIAIVDTGIDTSHQSFSSAAFDYAISQLDKDVDLLTSSELTSLKRSLSLNGNGTYVNSKIPYGYNYVDRNTTITHLNDTEGEHGSHVAGIASANRFIKSGNSYVDAAETVKAVGMAPDAQLFVMKVFGRSGGAYDSDYFAAIEDALLLGCDTVNLSLGSPSQGFTYISSYQNTLNKLTASNDINLVVTISAGNNGALTDELTTDLYIDDIYMHTGGGPGTYINSLGVAAAQNTGVTGTPLKFNGSQNVFYNETSSTGAIMTSIAGDYSYVYIDGIGSAAEYNAVNSAVSLSGKIVIVNRGELSFYEKGNNLKSYSPKGLIVANNVAGSINMALDDYTGTFPMVSITLADGETIKANSTMKTTGSYTYYTGVVKVTDELVSFIGTAREDAEITDFSSWGVPGSMLMKPDIAAPGGDIYSVYGTNKTSSGTAGGSDKYELMSGTSMAAPHMAGLGAVLAQYLKENNISLSGYSLRAINQSLLMSTATPMINNGNFVSILQQGSGLADVSKAVNATSIIMMGQNDNTLTAKTGAAKDGKVKAELGDNPTRENSYEYSFTIYNTNDIDVEYALDTKLFTQGRYTDGGHAFMSPVTTTDLIEDWNVSYQWENMNAETHDANQDNVTDNRDVQAILDYIVAMAAERPFDGSFDETEADLNADGSITTDDAYILIEWLKEDHNTYAGVVPANGNRKVTVTITPDHSLDEYYPSGAYVEGFTYINATTKTTDGALIDVEHTIPLLGFYGSWTDPSMFDNNSYTDTVYGTATTPYSGNTSNYMTIKSGTSTVKFSGNPYKAESVFPADRLAVKSTDQFVSIYYNLIRSAGTTGLAVTKTDRINGNVTSVLNNSVSSTNVTGLYYNSNSAAWVNTAQKTVSVNKTVSSYGLTEGDTFRIGFYAIPEYNAMLVNSNLTAYGAGNLNVTSFKNVLLSNVLGRGAFIGYDFTVDNTAPVIGIASKSGNILNVNMTDNANISYAAVKSSNGRTTYAEFTPGVPDYTLSYNVSSLSGSLVIFAADYAGNESSLTVNLSDVSGTIVPEDTDEPEIIEEDEEIAEYEDAAVDEAEDITEDSAEHSSGSLNSIINKAAKKRESRAVEKLIRTEKEVKADTEENDGTVTVTLSEDEENHNGLYKVTYDASKLELLSSEAKAEYKSIYEDTETGAVYLAYADEKEFAAEETIGTVTFKEPVGTAKVTVIPLEKTDEEPAEITVGEPCAVLLGMQLELEGKIIVDFYVEVPEEYAGAEVVMTTEDGTTRVPVEDGETSSYGNAKLYKYYALSTQMRDTITLYVEKDGEKVPMKTSSGTDYTNGYEYTILKSLDNYKNSTDENLVNLANAMDAFGQYVQILVKHNEEGLTPPQLEEVPMEDLDTYASTRDADLTTLKYAGARLELNSDTTIWLYYQPAEGHTLDEYTFTVDNNEVTAEESGGYYILKIRNIKSNELGHMYSIKATDGANTQTLNYSALSYADSIIKKNSDVNNVNACKAIYWYYKMAVAYFDEA